MVASGLFPMYLFRERLISRKRDLIRNVSAFLGFGFLGLVAEWAWTNKAFIFTPEEFSMIFGFFSALIAFYMVNETQKLLVIEMNQNFSLRPSKVAQAFRKTFERMRGKIELTDTPFEVSARVSGAYNLDFLLRAIIKESPVSKIQSVVILQSTPTGKTTSIPRLLFFLMTLPPIIARAYQTFDLIIDQYTLNAQVTFFVLFLALNLYTLLETSVQSSLLTEVDMISKKVVVDLAKEALAKKDTGPSVLEKLKEKKDEMKKPEVVEKPDVSALKERARKIKEMKAREAIEQRRKALRDRVETVFGPQQEGELDPADKELLERERLINNIKMVLLATPLGKEVTLDDIAQKVGHDNLKEVEQVIISLVERKEVRGFYDVWEGVYYVGDVSARFVDQTLSRLRLTPSEIEYIRISKGGEVEIRLRGIPDPMTISQRNDNSGDNNDDESHSDEANQISVGERHLQSQKKE